MKSIKPGRGPSMMSGVMCVVVGIFGVLWTIGAASIGGGLVSLFGILFIVVAIVNAVYNFKNATGEQRFSEYDIVDSKEEADPLNEYFGGERPSVESGDCVSEDRAFCPYCGEKVESDYRFCAGCGRKLPHND